MKELSLPRLCGSLTANPRHHIEDWADGGATDLDNLVSLCHFHHRRPHDAAFRITRRPGIGLACETGDGQPIVHRLPRVDCTTPRTEALRDACGGDRDVEISADTPGAKDGCARLDLDYVVSVVLDGVHRAREPPAH